MSRRTYPIAALTVLMSVVTIGLITSVARATAALPIVNTHNASLTTYLPSAKTNVQDVRPLVTQRDVQIAGDRTTQEGRGNRNNPNCCGNETFNYIPHCNEPGAGECCYIEEATLPNWKILNGVQLNTGAYSRTDFDLYLSAAATIWPIGRTYNAHQEYSSSHHDSDGYQGKNWFQISQPELLLYEDGNDDDDDVLYMVYGADRFVEFKRKDLDPGTSDEFKGTNGAAGAFQYAAGSGSEPDTYTLTQPDGALMVFFGFDGDASPAPGQLWKIVAPGGKTVYVGDKTTASTAISSGYDGSGRITTVYQELDDSAIRRYTYDYTSGRLDSVIVAEKPSGGSYSDTGHKVEYSYYGDETYGDPGDLETVTITTPLTDSGVSLVKKRYYRYWEGTFNAETNPGHPHAIQYIYDFEGIRQFDYSDATWDDDFLTASESSLKPYASAYFEYDSSHRISKAWFNGACGCSGAADGTYEFTYEDNTEYTDNSGYDTEWATRTVVKRPDGSYLTQYFDEVGQPLHQVITEGDPASAPGDTWVTKVVRNSDGQVTSIHSPANVTAYTHTIGGSWGITTSTSAGLVTLVTRYTTGDTKGFIEHVKHQEGTSGSAYLDKTYTYTTQTKTIGDVTLQRPLVASVREYPQAITSGTTGSTLTSYSYTFYTGSDTLRIKQITKTLPAVASGNNGSGSSNTEKTYKRLDGTVAFREAADGVFTYTEHEDGQVVTLIDDAKTNHATAYASGDDPNTDFGITETGDGVHRVTTMTYDSSGRVETVTQPDGRVIKQYYSKLADKRGVTLQYADYETSPSTKFYGPVQYTVSNLVGRTEVQSTVSLTSNESTTALTGHVDETDADPITAMDLGTVARLSVNVLDETGSTVEESRAYFSIPGSGDGTEGTNYDATYYGYDDSGRRWRVKDPTGTIRRTVYDSIGRPEAQWIGTNDYSFDGGEASGTDNMVKTSVTEYDSGNDGGNSYVTKVTLDEDGNWGTTSDQRVTEYDHDVRGNVLLQTSPNSPHLFFKYDNMQRRVAVGQFSSTASIDTSSDDPTTETSNRIGLSQTFYDEMGRVWKSQQHKIDDADGSDDDNLQTLTWYDDVGRVIKVDGEQLTKTAYDRLGRATHTFILASDNDTAYSDADDVTGDIVLEESQTIHESSDGDDVLMTALIDRFHDDYSTGETTGALDTNADSDDLKFTASNVKGRISVTAMWYDRFGRQIDQVAYGQYDTDSDGDFDDFDRDGLSVPARSDTALLTEQEYNTDGSLKSLTDPRNLETRFGYDDLGRRITVISNYVNGIPSGVNGDDDVHTRYVYTDGLQTKMWVDLDGDDVEDAGDQVTTYTFGTTKGASAGDSNIETGHLLQKVQYPDSAGGTDVVTYAYNAQGQQMWTKDQSGNIIETDFDTSGRVTHKRVTTIDGDFDNAVLRISTAYDNLGRPSTITQYDNATVGSGSVVDEVKYTYEDWGNVSKFEQDHNSTVATGGSYLYDIDYTYAEATTGRNTIRRSMLDLPDGTDVSYVYSSSGDLHDAEASRVSKINVGNLIPVTVATYDCNGTNSVVGMTYNEPDVMWEMFSSTSGLYPDLDRFNRVVSSRWTKDLATDVDFYDVDITYDRNGNIVLTVDNVYDDLGGTPKNLFDVDYTIDDLDRLTQAEEGHWTGSAIEAGTETRDQQWTLDQVGNWDLVKLDLNGDGDFIDAGGEYNDDRTHNDVNELTARDTDDNGTDDYTLTYDEVGQLTDDGEFYTYVYDAFGRLRQVKNRSTSALVVEHWYNGLGYRITTHYDTDSDDDVDANDTKFHFVYDDRWRIVAMYEDAETDPTEQFVYHNAGDGGYGGGSYIDSVVLRDRDTTGNGTLDERVYYCQNWRSDVVALVTDDGKQVEQVRYTAYGVPYGLPKGDTDGDGGVDSTDTTQIQSWIDAPSYDVRGDLDLDGDVDSTDKTDAQNNSSASGGWKVLTNVDNRKAYAGYEIDPAILANYATYHVRHRVLNSDLGRWARRDPLGYVDGAGLYEYVGGKPVFDSDSYGLAAEARVKVKSIALQITGLCPIPTLAARWELRLTRAAPSSGWIVQKVKIFSHVEPCEGSEEPPGTFEFSYWEAWRIGKGEKGPIVDDAGLKPIKGFTEWGAFDVFGPSDGHGSQTGWAHFYTDTDVQDDPPSGWEAPPWTGGEMPAKATKPDWWDEQDPPGGQPSRDMIMVWHCCCENSSKTISGSIFPAISVGFGTRSNVYWPRGPVSIP